MSRGHFYPLPPPFVGGRQPYAPSLGSPQSGPAPDAPPPLSRANLYLLARAPMPPPFIGGQQPYAARLGQSQSVVSGPPPVSNANLALIVRSYRDSQWTLIYTASIAPILAIPETIDNPPPRSYAALFSIIDRWKVVPNRPPQLKGVGQFSVPVVPDAPPPSSYANFNQILKQWEPRKWWPLPQLIGIGQYSVAATPDPPPRISYANMNVIRAQWPARSYPLPVLPTLTQVTVTVVVPIQEVIPYLIGEEEYSARQMLASIYMNVSVIGSGGTVTAQSVTAFTLADRGTTVQITMGGAINVPPRTRWRGNPPYGSSIQ